MLNKAQLLGRLIATPELKTTTNGISVTQFRIAVQRNFKNKSGTYDSDFLNVVAWRGTAQLVCKYFDKGDLIVVEGSIQSRSYVDKDGNKRTAVEILADGIHFVKFPKREEDAPHSVAPTL